MIKSETFFRLDLLILSLLSKKDYTCIQMSQIIQKQMNSIIEAKIGIIYTLLFHFESAHLVSQYEKDNQTYYHIESAGKIRLDMLKRKYKGIIQGTQNILHYELKVDDYE